MSKKRGRTKQQPVQVQAIPEEVLAEGSGPATSIDDSGDGSIEAAAEVLPTEIAMEAELSAELETTAIDEGQDELSAHGEGQDELSAQDEVELSAQGEGEVEGAIDGDGEVEVDGEVEAEAAAMPTSAASMDPVQLKQLIEALVFASDKPITIQRLRQLTRVSDVPRLEQTLTEIAADYAERGLVLQQVSGGFQFRTRPQFSAWVQQLIAGRPVRLSRAQLETLAIIAYRQPITRPEIDDIRGVDSSATLKLLMDRLLIRVLGKKEEVGRPMLYGTTREFLDFFSLGDLRELPTLREYSELSDESRKVMSNRLGIGLDGGDGEGGEGGGGGDDGGGDDGGGGDGGGGGGSSGSDDAFGSGGDIGGDGGGGGEEISASSLSDVASQVLSHDDSIEVTNEVPRLEAADDMAMSPDDALHAADGDEAMSAIEVPAGDDEAMSATDALESADDEAVSATEEPVGDADTAPDDAMHAADGDETISVDAETREIASILVEDASDDIETRELDPVTETVTVAESLDLDSSETRIVDPLIAAEVFAHAETQASSGESPE